MYGIPFESISIEIEKATGPENPAVPTRDQFVEAAFTTLIEEYIFTEKINRKINSKDQ
jgi:hypothetical protein